jgi:RimJ/RimL family protein N-acetyltransferase
LARPPTGPRDRPAPRWRSEKGAGLTAAPLQLIRATAADIPFVMATERLEGYERLVGRADDAWHRAALGDARIACFVGQIAGESIGFAILTDWASARQVTHLKRFAVVRPDQGLGRLLLRAVAEAVFTQTRAYRLSLGLFPENVRARRAYEAVGFQVEGVSRGSALFDGVNRDELVMALLRPEWSASVEAARGSN